jgi:glycosidase
MPRCVRHFAFLVLAFLCVQNARAEAMLELFQLTWNQIAQKMPEIAEAGYDSLWLPNPAKGNSGGYSVGYDVFDPFDLGSTNQQGTIATMYGTEAELIQMVQTAHRFGVRVYFDNVMNHRASTVPGYPGSGTPTNYYPGLIPQDFHLQTVSGGYENWPSVSEWCDIQNVENQPLLGLCDLAQEPGTVNWNFGADLGNTTTKPVYVRFPGRPDLYMDTNGPFLGIGSGGAGWRPFDGHGQPVAEDVTAYLCRAVAWTLYMTKCDGFRLDAVKHVPVDFFGAETGQTDDPSFIGYTGAIQAMYDYVHGYGSNVTGNGYVETDGNRNSLFDTEAARNDAMIFGEYEPSALQSGEDFNDYLQSGMRLLNFPLYSQMNSVMSGATMFGMDGRDFIPPGANCDANGNFSAAQAVNLPQDQDSGSCCPADQPLEDAYFFMHEGLPMVYSDGFNHNTNGGTPIVSYANFLGEFGDNTMPDTMYLHNQLARGGTWSRWGDQNVVLFERYDYREGNSAQPQTQDVALFGMNDDFGYPGDISFDDGINRLSDGYYLNSSNTTSTAISNSRGLGIVVGFAPGTVLTQLASSSPTGGRAYQQLLVHGATTNYDDALNSADAADPTQRLIYIGGQTPAPGGGAIELTVPSGAWVMYGYQWPEPSRSALTDAITFRQGGATVPSLTFYRQDGPNGDANFNPLYPFKMRGRIDQNGNVIGGINVSNLTYAIDLPIVTNANFDILVRSDASSVNTLIKLDGGIDLNSQMGLGPTNFQSGIAPTNFLDLRDNPPGYADDVFLGYEQAAFDFRDGPEKFAAEDVSRNNVTALGAETYSYFVGGTNGVSFGTGNGADITNSTAQWVYHSPTDIVNIATNPPPSQLNPLSPAAGQSVDVWVKVGYELEVNQCSVYYTADGSNPGGSYGLGAGTTKTVPGTWMDHDQTDPAIDWWKAAIPASANTSGANVRYAVAVFNNSIQPISDAVTDKLYGLTEESTTNFNPSSAVVWTANDLNTNNVTIGLQSGLHIVRARSFLPRTGQSSVYNTFLQSFYFDAATPAGVIVSPAPGSSVTNSTCTVIVRADSTATAASINIQDSNPDNDDVVTGYNYGNGSRNGVPIFVSTPPVAVTIPALDAIYTNLPQEFHFLYPAVPTNGSATITILLSEITTQVWSNRVTTLTDTFTTAAPNASLEISSPPMDGLALLLASNSVYTVQACFTPNLDTNDIENFTVTVNGVPQPRSGPDYEPLYYIGGTACEPALRTFNYTWVAPPPGSNVINVTFDGSEVLSAQRTVLVFDPQSSSPTYGLPGYDSFIAGTSPTNPATWLQITGIAQGLISWNSVPGKTYQVMESAELSAGFQPVSWVITATATNSSFLDVNYTNGPDRFYLIQVFP